MQVEIPEEASQQLGKASKLLGIKQKQIVERAILTYLDSIRSHLSLKKEFEQLESLSDEALITFEKSI